MELTLKKAVDTALPPVDECFVLVAGPNFFVWMKEVARSMEPLLRQDYTTPIEDGFDGTEEETSALPDFWVTGKYRGNGTVYARNKHGSSGRYIAVERTLSIEDEPPPYAYEPKLPSNTRSRFRLHELMDRLPGTVTPFPSHVRDLCFILAGCEKPLVRREQALLPVLIPCMGRLSRSGEKMQYFDAFLSGLEKERRHLLTPDQQALQELGLAIMKLVEKLPGSLLELEPGAVHAAHELLECWAHTLPMLHHQGYVFRYPIGGRTGLKGKPEKSRMVRALVGKDRPQLSFELHDSGEHCSLKPVLWLRGKQVTAFEARMPLFVSVGNTYYLASSLRDAAALEWMDGVHYRITVLKEDEAVFRKEVLDVLERFYEVKRL